jgi:hypothetical protein
MQHKLELAIAVCQARRNFENGMPMLHDRAVLPPEANRRTERGIRKLGLVTVN